MIESIAIKSVSPPGGVSDTHARTRAPSHFESPEPDEAADSRPLPESREERRAAFEQELNRRIERLFSTNLRLRIETDEGTGNFVYQSIDRDTGEVKRQWPPEAILKMMAFFNELEGLLVDETV